MFRCIECQKEYEIRPDFCECGGDVFEEVFSQDNSDNEKDYAAPKKNFKMRYPMLSRFLESLDPISSVIFGICMVLSVLSLIFVGFEANEEIANNIVPDNINNVKILDIEKLWDDTPPREVKKLENKEEKVLQKTESQIAALIPVKIEQKKTVNNNQSTKTQANKAKTAVNNQKSPKTQAKTQIQNPKTQTATAIKKVEEKPKTSNISQNNTKVNEQNNAQKEILEKEFKNYKIGLRNLLFSKIDFTQIEGDGVCIVTFKISDKGVLINKNFLQTSASDMLNDAVFYAVNTTYSYKTPPSLYKGETLKFTVKFQNGQYAIGLN